MTLLQDLVIGLREDKYCTLIDMIGKSKTKADMNACFTRVRLDAKTRS